MTEDDLTYNKVDPNFATYGHTRNSYTNANSHPTIFDYNPKWRRCRLLVRLTEVHHRDASASYKRSQSESEEIQLSMI